MFHLAVWQANLSCRSLYLSITYILYIIYPFIVCQRVMPSGFFVLLRHFLRIDDVLIRMHDTRFHCEIENDYILKEYIHREAPCSELQVNTHKHTHLYY